MDFQEMMINDLMRNELYKEKDVANEGFATESRPYIEQEVMDAYELGYKKAIEILREKLK